MSFDLGLSGRRALVTAGTQGVGASVIEVLRENGAKVVSTARSIPRSSLAGVHTSQRTSRRPRVAPLSHKAPSTTWRHRHRRQRARRLGGAGRRVRRLDDEAWRKEIDLNLMPAVRLDRARPPFMLAQTSGLIVHVTSIQHELPLPKSTTAYAAAKAALSTYSKVVERSDAKGDPCGACVAGLGETEAAVALRATRYSQAFGK